MSYKKIVTRVLLPAAAATVCTVTEYKCKPSELPIYKPDLDSKTWAGTTSCPEGSDKAGHLPPTLIEEAVGSLRKQLGTVCSAVGVYKKSAVSTIDTFVDQVAWVQNYLADENNVAPKPGAIGIGALTGFVLGLRGGLLRRVIFTGAGGLAMAALCYPKQATEYSKLGLSETKKYVIIGYNFIYGGKEEELDMNALLLLDPNLVGVQHSQDVVEQLHEDAQQADCHCPVGTCLSSHDDDEGAQTDKMAISQDGEEVVVQGEDCCVCICDDDD